MATDETPHHRDLSVDVAVVEILGWIADWKYRHQLTDVEYLHILTQLQKQTLMVMGTVERFALVQREQNGQRSNEKTENPIH